jgi:hypothetical protein
VVVWSSETETALQIQHTYFKTRRVGLSAVLPQQSDDLSAASVKGLMPTRSGFYWIAGPSVGVETGVPSGPRALESTVKEVVLPWYSQDFPLAFWRAHNCGVKGLLELQDMNHKIEHSRIGDSQILVPLPPLAPYQRCRCGSCRECRDNQKWDRAFAKFEVIEDNWKTKGFFQSTLRGW